MTKGFDALSQQFGNVELLDQSWFDRARAHLNSLAKPPGSLGDLEDVAARVVAIQQADKPDLGNKAVYVFAADHGIAIEGVSAYPQVVTKEMASNFLSGGAAINVLARAMNAEVHTVDVGINADLTIPGLISKKVRHGTQSFLRQPAMTSDEMQAAMHVGYDLARQAYSRRVQLVAVGEMGIGNTTAASAITAAMTGQSAEAITGPGTGVTGTAFHRKKQVINDALALHFPNYQQQRPDPVDILRCVGGLEIAAICGFILGAAHKRLVMVIDGFISTAAAAIAYAFCPAARDYLFAGHLSQEIGHKTLLEYMGLRPLLNLRMRLGEGTGATLAFGLMDAAIRIYDEMATFDSAGVSGATHE